MAGPPGLRAQRFSHVAALHEEPHADAAHGDDRVLGARGSQGVVGWDGSIVRRVVNSGG